MINRVSMLMYHQRNCLVDRNCLGDVIAANANISPWWPAQCNKHAAAILTTWELRIATLRGTVARAHALLCR